MKSKTFHIGDLITIVEGCLVCPRINGRTHPIDGVYELLNFMAGESLFTHALPRVGNECKPVLIEHFPWLEEITFPGVPDNIPDDEVWDWIMDWLKIPAEKYGEWHEVFPLHQEDHEFIHPLEEPIVKGKQIIEFNIDDEQPPNPEGDINWNVN